MTINNNMVFDFFSGNSRSVVGTRALQISDKLLNLQNIPDNKLMQATLPIAAGLGASLGAASYLGTVTLSTTVLGAQSAAFAYTGASFVAESVVAVPVYGISTAGVITSVAVGAAVTVGVAAVLALIDVQQKKIAKTNELNNATRLQNKRQLEINLNNLQKEENRLRAQLEKQLILDTKILQSKTVPSFFNSGTPFYHTVEQGETWSSIAHLYTVGIEDLIVHNKLHINNRELQYGDIIQIPTYETINAEPVEILANRSNPDFWDWVGNYVSFSEDGIKLNLPETIVPENFWKDADYVTAMLWGIIDGLWSEIVGMYEMAEMVQKMQTNPNFMFELQKQWSEFIWNLYKNENNYRTQVLNKIQLIKEDTGNKFKAYLDDIAFKNGEDDAGYQHGLIIFTILSSLTGAEEIRLIIKGEKKFVDIFTYSISEYKKLYDNPNALINKIEKIGKLEYYNKAYLQKVRENSISWKINGRKVFNKNRRILETMIYDLKYKDLLYYNTETLQLRYYNNRSGNDTFKLFDYFIPDPYSKNIVNEKVTKTFEIKEMVSLKTTNTKDVNQWLINNKKHLVGIENFMKRGIKVEGITYKSRNATMLIEMPKENLTTELMATWKTAIFHKYPGIDIEFISLDDFIK